MQDAAVLEPAVNSAVPDTNDKTDLETVELELALDRQALQEFGFEHCLQQACAASGFGFLFQLPIFDQIPASASRSCRRRTAPNCCLPFSTMPETTSISSRKRKCGRKYEASPPPSWMCSCSSARAPASSALSYCCARMASVACAAASRATGTR
jgi:hypothetical protein